MIAGWLERRTARDAAVVFLGDSITQYWFDEDPRFFAAGWLNRGVSGEATREMRARFARDVIEARPRAVHIMGGTNDVWHGAPGEGGADAIANLEGMVAAARAAGIATVLAAPPPIARGAAPLFGHPALLAPIRAAAAQIAAAHGAATVDYAASLCDSAGELVPAFTTDGVHLTGKGYRAMRGQARNALRAALAQAETAGEG